MATVGKSNGDRRSADHHMSRDKTGLHSKQKRPHRENGEGVNKMATATCRCLYQRKSDTVAGETRETTELLWVPLLQVRRMHKHEGDKAAQGAEH